MSVDDRLRSGLSRNAATFEPAVESGLDVVRVRARRRRAARGALVGGSIAAAAAVAVAVIAGARGSREPSPVLPAPSTSALFGRYEATVTAPDRVAGQWVLAFQGNGALLVTPPRGYAGVVSGTLFTADGLTLRTNLFAQDLCAGLPNGEYSWTRDGDHLLLAPVAEPCAPRARFLAGSDWVGVPRP